MLSTLYMAPRNKLGPSLDSISEISPPSLDFQTEFYMLHVLFPFSSSYDLPQKYPIEVVESDGILKLIFGKI